MKLQVLDHLFKLLDILLTAGKPLSMAELGRLSGIERNAAWRIVSDLCDQGYLRRVGTRAVEPGMGMVFLGQASYSENFFPNLVYRELRKAETELKVRCALAGLFHEHLVYFYRSDPHNLYDSWRWPLFASNIATCILTQRDGPVEALRKISETLAASELVSEEEKPALLEQIHANIDHLERYRYCIQCDHGKNNVAFPLRRNGQSFGLAFYNLPNDEKHLHDFIARGSKLRAKLSDE